MIKSIRIADVLTALRIISSPLVVWLIFSDETLAAYYLFAAAALTDLLDGYFARRCNKIVSYGATFDGIADFLLVYPTILAIAIKGEGLWLLVAALISIAFLIPVMGLISKKKGNMTILHLDTNLLAAFVYPTVMVHIINWRYADVLLLAGFLVLLYYGSKYVVYLRKIYQ